MQGIRYIQAIFFLLCHLPQIKFGIVVVPQRRCPSNQKDWEEKSNRTNCYGDGVYHCMQDQGGRYVSFCAKRLLIQPDYCPEFNTNVSPIDVILCPGALHGCPEKPFMSNEIYNYPSCFRTVTRTTTKSTTSGANTTTSSISWSQTPANDDQNEIPELSVLFIVLGIIVPIIVIIILVLLLRTRRNLCKNELNRRYLEETEEVTRSLMDMENTSTTNPSEDMGVNIVIDQKNVSEKDQRKDLEHNENFVKPANYGEAVKKVKNQGYVVLYGVTGSGKSTLAKYIVKNEFSEHRVLHLRGKQNQAPNLSSDGGLLFWDDCFGIWNVSDDENKDDILKHIKEITDKCRKNPQTYKAVLCFDSFFFDVDQFRGIANTMDLDKNYDSQVRMERFSDEMARNKTFLIRTVSTEVGFPLLISLILEDPYLKENKNDFLKDPTPFVHKKYQNLLKDNPDVYVTLIYAVCNCPVNLREVSKERWDILKKECKQAGSRESEKYTRSDDSLKNAKNKADSKIPEEDSIQIPTSGDYSEKLQESENISPHKDTMGGGYKTVSDVNEGTNDCDRNGTRTDGNFANDNIEKNRDKVEDSDNSLGYGDRSSNKSNAKGKKILKRRKVIGMNENLAKYLVKNESREVQFEFRHQFLAESLLRFHVEQFGKIGVSKAANDEVAFVLTKI